MNEQPSEHAKKDLEVVEPPSPGWDVRELTAIEKTVRDFAYTLFGLLALVTIVILTDWLLRRPSLPQGLAQSDAKAAIENYKVLSDVGTENAIKMFDLLVVKALLPVFATITGVLLGRRQS